MDQQMVKSSSADDLEGMHETSGRNPQLAEEELKKLRKTLDFLVSCFKYLV